MNISNTDSAALEAGKSALEVLNHPAFQSALMETVNSCVVGFLKSPPDAKDQRENCYMVNRAVEAFVNVLNARVEAANSIQAKLDAETHIIDEHEPITSTEE